MNISLHFSSRPDVEAALESAALVPPPPPTGLEAGATMDLRNLMARFSTPELHARRRTDAVHAIDHVDLAEVESVAAHRTEGRLAGGRVEAVADIAYAVPTECLAQVLGVAVGEFPSLMNETRLMVEVIGRGRPSSSSSDQAVARILDRFRSHPAGPVAVASMLYQNHDATAALISSTIHASGMGIPRHQAVVGTVRVAVADATVGDTLVAAGSHVTLDLETAGLEFGAGPHQCPGQVLAEVIVAGVTRAIETSNYQLLADEVVLDDDGRPTALPMTPR